MILTADLHLVDTPSEEYRWDVFQRLYEFCYATEDWDIYILGDLTDRKDRHSSELVNRMIHEFRVLLDYGRVTIKIIMGNHDMPLKGPPYWTFLTGLHPNLKFYTKPTLSKGVMLLPYSAKPEQDWADLDFSRAEAVFMHQPVEGALLESGRKYEGGLTFKLPKLPIYSGDIHTPQVIQGVTYVGAPHPIKFGDEYQCRFLRLDNKFQIKEVCTLSPPRKLAITVASTVDLHGFPAAEGDRARVVFQLDPNKIEQWPVEKAEIIQWAKDYGVKLESVIADVTFARSVERLSPGLDVDPEELLRAFAKTEGLPEPIIEVGLQLLEEYRA